MAALWWSSSRTPPPSEPDVVRAMLHNSMHVFAYGALAGSLLLWFGIETEPRTLRRRSALASVVLAVAYGGVDEWHQSRVPGRVCSAADLLSDAMGAVLAVAVVAHLVVRHGRAAAALPYLVLGCALSTSLATFTNW